MYSRVVTDEGRRFVEALGFRLGTRVCGAAVPHLYCFPRGAKPTADRPLYDSYRPGQPRQQTSVTIARSFEDMAKIVSIRSAVYIAEQDCPYEEEYDGNDFSATHLIGYAGDEPAGCLRIRYFAEFAKIERLAVRHEFRQSRLAFQLARAGIALCQAKGYRRLYGHAKKDLLAFWQRFGFRAMEGGREFVFSDHDYVEIAMETVPAAGAVTLGQGPYVTIRPEGRWHVPGVLDRSAVRAPKPAPAAQASA
jgi:predicted GNAT family N-acyltransferase